MKCIDTYFRDGKELSGEEWIKMLKQDSEIEQQSRSWDVFGVLLSDIDKGRDVEVNGHYYEQRTDFLYETAKELFEDLLFEGHHDVIIDALERVTEEELFNVLSKSKYIDIKVNKKLLLKDEKRW